MVCLKLSMTDSYDNFLDGDKLGGFLFLQVGN